jgi:hypothetical protein
VVQALFVELLLLKVSLVIIHIVVVENLGFVRTAGTACFGVFKVIHVLQTWVNEIVFPEILDVAKFYKAKVWIFSILAKLRRPFAYN